MTRPLRVLVVEDSEDDAELILRTLRKGGFEFSATRVDTAVAMAAALRDERWDVVLSDHSMPGFSAPSRIRLRSPAASCELMVRADAWSMARCWTRAPPARFTKVPALANGLIVSSEWSLLTGHYG